MYLEVSILDFATDVRIKKRPLIKAVLRFYLEFIDWSIAEIRKPQLFTNFFTKSKNIV